MLKLFANCFWIYTPGFFQKRFSKIFSVFFRLKISRFFILPYCLAFGLNAEYLDQFEPESEELNYQSYSDFFKRRYKTSLEIQSDYVWPCEGYICDWGHFSKLNKTIVKGETLDLNDIFKTEELVTRNYFFTNIFLHNHNYHRVHSPISGRISKITRIPGDLIFLRPWFYKRADVSYPAVRNERFIFEITDAENRAWYLAMVGGFGVGSIEIHSEFINGGEILAGQEFAKFNLGSTVCLATPSDIQVEHFLQTVSVGRPLKS